ncbi:oligopeptide ABC transporter substrate-binding protein [Oceanobacillus chungangensis]|uniref:Oligopeptide ABC transporter substrate-binding protein n=1 Tax=Oceanobacillus chungangensis TaxID=1229152 RepID=A0A3D8PK24_9BACI|nr:oligopeptide ABC transporter substrate-binding protein [Oceanobacillus chungangensis]RDW15581.1 oligopeptide ABC transporter substrate-binding protein [Oceanobacillus chungangensis]
MKQTKWLLALMLALVLVLAACSSGGTDEEKPADSEDPATDEGTDEGAEEDADAEEPEEEADSGDNLYSIDDFSPDKTNEGDAIDGGTLNYGLVSDTAFEGILNPVFYEGNPDFLVMKFFEDADGLLSIENDNFTYTQDGAAEWEVDEAGTTFTIKIRDNVNWHDGEPVKAEDLEFAHEVIGSPDYTGMRYYAVENVVGIDEYNAGEADKISGIEVVDEKTIKITFKEANPSLLAGGIWTAPMPKHIFKDIPVAEMAESDAVRVNPIGYGPFKVEQITPGESVTYTANEDYWQGAPKLDGVTLKVIPPTTVANALETGEVDIAQPFPTDQYPDVEQKLTNVEFLGQQELGYTYIGFKLGKFDAKKGESVTDPDAKMADVNLRKAMWYAVDNNAVGEKFYNGLRWQATTLIIPPFKEYHDPSIETPTYDPEEAKRILDEAGYVDVDGDGLRENPDGEELVINFASMSGGDVAEPMANYYVQAWKAVGLNVQLLGGGLVEFNSFYDKLEGDDDEVDVYQGAWGTGTDVDQTGLYGRNAGYNYTRYTSEKNDELLAAGASEASLDPAYHQDIYKQWQELMVEDIPLFPTLYRSELTPVNNRVTDFSIKVSWVKWHEVGVTQEKPLLP